MATSSTRALRLATLAVRAQATAPLASSSTARCASTYTPAAARGATLPKRQPRPASPGFFSAKPVYTDTIAMLEERLETVRETLRKQYVWPLPPAIPFLQPTNLRLMPANELSISIRSKADYRKLAEVLNALNHIRHVAELSGNPDIVEALSETISPFERLPIQSDEGQGGLATKPKPIDGLGRSHAVGRRKESSARVWVVPSEAGQKYLDEAAGQKAAKGSAPTTPESQILVNHLPLSQHFARPVDREAVLRPLRLTGLLGAYNVFGLVRGGGTTGQSGALALAVAKAIRQLRPETSPILITDGALVRDPRMVERKKTNLVKARKRRTWVKR